MTPGCTPLTLGTAPLTPLTPYATHRPRELLHCPPHPVPPAQEETPLFLAAREGSYEAARVLLDHSANRELSDHVERLPRDVARERLHHDIVRLLDHHDGGRGPLQPPPALLGPPAPFLPTLKPPKKNRRGGGGKAGGPKGRGGRKAGGECLPPEGSVALSPVDSPYGPTSVSPGVFPHPALDPPFTVTVGPPLGVGRLARGPQPTPPTLGLALGTVPIPVPFKWHSLGRGHPLLHPPTSSGLCPPLLLPLPCGPQPQSPEEEGGPPRPAPPHCFKGGEELARGRFLGVPPEHPYLTPSPESPEQWASPSPCSFSDWSEATPSPTLLGPPQTQLPPLSP